MQISIMIPTLNEEKLLPVLLKSIKSQSFTDYEIIIADNDSTDRTRQIAKKFGAKIAKGGLPGPARNSGAKAATGQFLFFFDADAKLPKGFLQDAYSEMQERFLDLATCEMQPMSKLNIDKAMHDFANFSMKLAQYSVPHAPGSCILVTKRLFDRAGGFNEELHLAEDHDFVMRASKFRPLRLLASTYIMVSVRRMEKEGRLNIMAKYLRAEMHRLFKGEIRESTIPYEFANFDEKQKDRYEKILLSADQKLTSLKNKLSAANAGKIREEFKKTVKKLADNLPR